MQKAIKVRNINKSINERKILDNINKTINLSTMALKLEETIQKAI